MRVTSNGFLSFLVALLLILSVEATPSSSHPFVDEKFKNFVHYSSEGPNLIGHLYIGGHETSISEATWLYIKQGLEYYKKMRPVLIILELDTPGGEVFVSQKIADTLKEMDIQFDIPIVAYINNWAISAGAMLAYSCRFIVSAKDGSMGAAEPVYLGETGKLETASEKVNSALRADFASRALFFDRNPAIAEAMVDKDVILVWRKGEVVRLDQESQIIATGLSPDRIISPKGKLLTLGAEQMKEYGVADLVLAPLKVPEISLEEKQVGKWPANRFPLFHAPPFSAIPHAVIVPYQMDWKTTFFTFLATPAVSSLLVMGLLVGAYAEMSHPGLSLPGVIAGCCLLLIILSSFALEVAHWLELIILLIGLALILAELFLLSTFGLLGILGVFLFFIGLFGMLLPGLESVSFEYDTQTLNAAGQYVLKRFAWLCAAWVVSVAFIVLLARYVLPGFHAFNPFVLVGHEQEASKGFVASFPASEASIVGKRGKVFSSLRPSGKVMIQGSVYDAMSAGEFIEAGELVIVVRQEGATLLVEQEHSVA